MDGEVFKVRAAETLVFTRRRLIDLRKDLIAVIEAEKIPPEIPPINEVDGEEASPVSEKENEYARNMRGLAMMAAKVLEIYNLYPKYPKKDKEHYRSMKELDNALYTIIGWHLKNRDVDGAIKFVEEIYDELLGLGEKAGAFEEKVEKAREERERIKKQPKERGEYAPEFETIVRKGVGFKEIYDEFGSFDSLRKYIDKEKSPYAITSLDSLQLNMAYIFTGVTKVKKNGEKEEHKKLNYPDRTVDDLKKEFKDKSVFENYPLIELLGFILKEAKDVGVELPSKSSDLREILGVGPSKPEKKKPTKKESYVKEEEKKKENPGQTTLDDWF